MYAVMLVKTTSTTSKASISFPTTRFEPPNPQSSRSPGGANLLPEPWLGDANAHQKDAVETHF